MSVMGTLNQSIAGAMKAKEQARLSTLRMMKAALMNREVEKGHALSDAEELQVISTMVKQRKESIEQFLAGGRQDLVDKEKAELVILESYLPPAIDAADLERIVGEVVQETGATSPKDMGKVMKAVMARLAGATIDGKLVNEIVRKKLAS
jgi:uncharacterized protein